MANIGQDFFKETSYLTSEPEPAALNEPMAPGPVLTDSVTPLEIPQIDSELSRLIAARRSKRDFSDAPMTMDQLQKILWLSQGVTAELGRAKLRAVASAGNLHPFNTYLMVSKVDGIEKGLYLYRSESNDLVLIKKGDFAGELEDACFGQKLISKSQITCIQTAVTARTTTKYRGRGYRYLFLDAGHIGAQLQLICEDIGLGSCNVGAYWDSAVSKFLEIKSEFEIPVYMTAIGKPK